MNSCICGPGTLETIKLLIFGAKRSSVRILATPAMVTPGICLVRSVMIRALSPDFAALVSRVVSLIASRRSTGSAMFDQILMVIADILLPGLVSSPVWLRALTGATAINDSFGSSLCLVR